MRSAIAPALLVLSIALPAFAQTPPAPPVRVRGTIEQVSGQTLTVKGQDGKTITATLPANAIVTYPVKLTAADIKPDSFLGVGSVKKPDGKLHAVAIQVFPEAQRGTGEGERVWVGAPEGLTNGTMTNATVAKVDSVAGGTLALAYKGGTTDVIIDPSTSITTPHEATMAMLTPGKIVALFATKQADGNLTASRVSVENNGVKP
jgi:hypothetical protein